MSEAEARQRIDSASAESKIQRATVVIDNSGTLQETRQQVASPSGH